jgi:hypothetical protein
MIKTGKKPESAHYMKGKVYTVTDQVGEELLALTDDQDMPIFRKPRPKVAPKEIAAEPAPGSLGSEDDVKV